MSKRVKCRKCGVEHECTVLSNSERARKAALARTGGADSKPLGKSYSAQSPTPLMTTEELKELVEPILAETVEEHKLNMMQLGSSAIFVPGKPKCSRHRFKPQKGCWSCEG
jgi:hypothetical protein